MCYLLADETVVKPSLEWPGAVVLVVLIIAVAYVIREAIRNS